MLDKFFLKYEEVGGQFDPTHPPTQEKIPSKTPALLELIMGDSGPGKTNSLFNLINEEPDIDKIYLYVRDAYEAKYQFLLDKRKSTGLKHFNNSKAFTEYSNDVDDIYKNIEE